MSSTLRFVPRKLHEVAGRIFVTVEVRPELRPTVVVISTDSVAVERIVHVHYKLDSVALTLHEVLHRLRDDPLATRSHVAVTPLIITPVSNCDERCGVAVEISSRDDVVEQLLS